MKKAIIVILSIILVGFVGFICYGKFYNTKPNLSDNNGEYNEEDISLAEYGILSYGEINPFKNLDFGKIVGYNYDDEDSYIKINGNIITYVYYDFDEDDNQKEISYNLEVNNLRQAGLACDCSGCYAIYYLSGNSLYEVSLDHNNLEKDEDGTYNSSTRLITKNVAAFTLFEVDEIEMTTCGGYELIVKYNNGEINLLSVYFDEDIETYNINQFEREMISYISGSELYVVSNNAKVWKYIINEKNEKIVAKKVLINEIYNDDENTYVSIYVLNKDDYLYYVDDITKVKLNKYNDSKVISISEENENVLVRYENGKSEIINAEIAYDYSL